MQQIHFQRTIAKEAECTGVGIHSGQVVRLSVKPAPINHGIKFMRTDLPDRPCVPARFNRVVDTSLATVIGDNGFIISTVEHLMAAFSGLGIDNALVEVSSYEMPIMDGSAGPFSQMLLSAGIQCQDAPRCYLVVNKPIELKAKDKFVGIYPAPDFRVSCTIEFQHPLIQIQEYSMVVTEDHFAEQIADARTFGFLHEQAYMQKFGLGQGASLDNVVVVGPDGVLNENGLRYPDEFVRHKLLDCIGDFALLGLPLLGHIIARRSGHSFHHAFIEKFFRQKDAWQTKSFEDERAWTDAPAKQLAY